MTHDVEDARETPDVQTRWIVATMSGVLAFVAVTLCGLYFFYSLSTPGASFIPPKAFPAPQLVTDADGRRDPLIARQQMRLRSYSWIDRERGVVQIPIDKAMSLIQARGAEAYNPLSINGARPRP